jgi:hypothetical protein
MSDDDPFGLAKINAAIAGAKPNDEYRTMAGAAMALQPCARHCTVCEGYDHHWLAECDSEGMPIMICKHCEAWREYTDADMQDELDD